MQRPGLAAAPDKNLDPTVLVLRRAEASSKSNIGVGGLPADRWTPNPKAAQQLTEDPAQDLKSP